MSGPTSATFSPDPYNPAYYYLANRNNPSNIYYNYYINLTFFNDLRWPVPAFWNVYLYYDKIEFWSALIGWPPLELFWTFCIVMIVPSFLMSIFGYLKYLNITGFEGFEWN